MKLSIQGQVALLSLAFLSVSSAHNLDQQNSRLSFEQQTVDLMAARAASGNPLLQAGDTVNLILKATPGPGTLTGAGGYLTFYIPEGTQVVGAEYGTLDSAGNFVPKPIKGPAINAIGDGAVGSAVTAALIGLNLGPNILGTTAATVSASGVHAGTIAGVYADTGIFYSTDPRTVYNSFASTGGYDRLLSSTNDNILTNNSGDSEVPTTLWDAEQLIGFGLSSPASPIVDPNGRGNSPWGTASAVAGPQSGYAWEFNWGTYLSGTGANRMKNSIKVGPWKRIQYPGSQVGADTPGLKGTVLGFVGRDASTLGTTFPLPETLSWSDDTSPKSVRFSFGALELGRPEYARIKLKVVKGPGEANSPFNNAGAFTAYSDAFGGDAGGEQNGKDHLWRYYDPVRLNLGSTMVLQKVFAKPFLAPGEVSSFKLQIINTGSAALTNVTLSDPLPSGLTYLGASLLPSSTSPLTWKFASIAPFSTQTITVSFKASSIGSISNTAQLSADQQSPVFATDTVEVAVKAILDVDKTVTPSTAQPGDVVTYTMTMTNNGTGANGTPLKITENLPAVFNYTQLVSAKLNGAAAPAGVVTVSATNANRPVFTVSQSIQPGKTLELVFKTAISGSQASGVYGNVVSYNYESKTLSSPSLAPVTVVGGRIGDTVFNDWNGNGVQDANDNGLSGVTVSLFASNGTTLLATGTTDANGGYLFTGRTSGTYVVKTSNLPAGYVQTYDADGLGSAHQSTVVLPMDGSKLDQDFGYQPTGKGGIGDTVFEDVDNDGVYTAGIDLPLPNITVRLYNDTNSNGLYDAGTDTVSGTTSSSSAGTYSFTDLPAGKYVVVVDSSDADLPTRLVASRSTVAVTLAASSYYLDADFPFVPVLRKSVDKSSLTSSGTLTYTLTPVYTGSQALSGVNISDSIPNGTSYVNGSVTSSGSYFNDAVNDPPLRVEWDLGSNTAASPGVFSSQATVTGTVNPVADSYVTSASPTSNFGTNTSLLINGTNATQKSYLRFNLSGSIPQNATLLSATMTMQKTGGDNTARTVSLFQVNQSWIESGTGGITFNNQPTSSSTVAASTTVGGNGTYSWNVLNLVQGWVTSGTSFGVVATVPSTINKSKTFASKENGTAGNRPKLIYRYVALSGTYTKTSLTTDRSLVSGTAAQPVTVTLSFESRGQSGTGSVTAPANLTIVNSGSHTVTRVSGPTAVSGTTIASGSGTVSYSYVYNITPGSAPGSVTFSGTAATTSGTGFPTFPSRTQFLAGTSQSVLVTPNLSYKVLASGTVSPIINVAQIEDAGVIPLRDSNPAETRITSSIGDTFFYDTNSNGIQDGGETGVPNAVVVLYGDTNGNGAIDSGEPIVGLTNTDANGKYLFDNLAPGNYVVKGEEQHVVAPPSSANAGKYGTMQGTAGTSRAVNLGVAQSYLQADIGFAEVAVVEGHVFHDINTNAYFDDGETPLPNVPVSLTGTSIGGNAISRSGTTSSSGEYEFIVPAGTYTVSYDTVSTAIPATLKLATTGTSFLVSPKAGDEIEGLDFGRAYNGTVGDLVWADLNKNGVVDPGEPGLSNVSVALYSDANLSNLLGSVVTDAQGNYLFKGLSSGTYWVTFESTSLPKGYKTTPVSYPGLQQSGSFTGKTNVILTGTGGMVAFGAAQDPSILTIDYGFEPNTDVRAISGYVFKDSNKNGTPDTPTEALSGIKVTASVDTDGDGTEDLSFTVDTDSDGKYLFSAIPKGSNVTITVGTLPENLKQSVDPDATLDSSTKVLNVTEDVTDQNFGYLPYGTVGGHLYYDTNGNGTQDDGEPNLANVDIFITDANGQLSSVTTDANGDWSATVPPGTTKADVDESDPDFKAVVLSGYVQTEGSDPTTVTAVLASDVDAGKDGYVNPKPGIGLVKSGTVSTGSSGILLEGDHIEYTFVASNTGNVTLTNVILSDTNATLYSGTIASIAPGASGTFTGYHVLTQAQINSGTFTNIATVSGKDPNNTIVSGTDDHIQPLIQNPGLSLVKSGTLSTGSNGILDEGDRINYTFVVSNTGNVTLTNLILSDTNATLASGTLASLIPGASGTFTGYHVLTQAQINSGTFTNIATVSGKDPGNTTVSGTDDHIQPLTPNPGLSLVKSGTVATGSNGVLAAGDQINYTFVVSNTGNVTLTGVILSDTNATLSSGTLASLEPGASGTFSGYHVLTQAQINSGTFTNIATVSGTAPNNTTVSGTDDHIQPLVQNPGLSLVKSGTVSTGSSGVLVAGDQINYTFVVSNTGNVTLAGVILSDTNASLLSGTLASLEPGASGTFSGYHVLTQAQIDSGTFTNIATVSGTAPSNTTVSGTDDHVQPLVQNPGLSLVKSGTLSSGSNGVADVDERIEYTFVVSNTGNVTLTNVVLSDTNATILSGTLASLEPGASGTFTGYHVLTQAQINSGTFTNIATASGKDPGNTTVSGTDDHVQPFDQISGLALVKSGTVATGSNGIVDSGERIEYTFVVSNTGNVTLTNIVLSDTNASLVSGTLASLEPGASGTFSGYHLLTQGQINSGTFTNIATVSGKDPGNTTVSGTDDHIQPLVQNPGLNLVKSGTLSTGSNSILDVGDQIDYTFVVSNTGNVTLTDIVLSDTNASLVSGTLASLEPGASGTFTGYHVLTQAQIDSGTFTNIATVSGKDPAGSDVSDEGDHSEPLFPVASIDLLKKGTLDIGTDGSVDVDDKIIYKFKVTNTGQATLTNITISDSNAVISGTLASLAPGESDSTTFTGYHLLTQVDIESGTFTNTATVTGQDPRGKDVSDSDSHIQKLEKPGIDLTKLGTLHTGSNGRADAGDEITYTFTIENIGTVPLTNVILTDSNAVISGTAIATLIAGGTDSLTYTGTYVLTQADIDSGKFTNVATVVGTDPDDIEQSASDEHTVNLTRIPGLSLLKTGTVATGSNGILDKDDRIEYTFVVSNTGNVTLTDIVLSDTNATIESGTLASLAPGASGTFTGYHILTQAQIDSGTFTNIATASGKDPNNTTVSGTDDHIQPMVQIPGLTLVKSGTLTTGSNGIVDENERIEYTFVVSNTGNVTLSNLVLTDTNAVLSSGSTLASLAPGTSGTFTGYHVLTQAQINSGTFTNIATVLGYDPKGTSHTDSDNHTETFTLIPGLQLVKSGTITTGSNGMLNPTDRIEYTFVVSNTGNVTLTNVVLSDTNATLISGTLASLAPGASGTFTGYHPLTQEQINSGTFTNIATVSGKDPTNTTVSGTDDHIQPLEQNPGLSLVKSGTLSTGSNGVLNAGDQINYTFVVSNTGNVTLTSVVLSDTNATLLSGTLASLLPGASGTFTGYHVLTQEQIDSGTFTNIATVSGYDPGDATISGTDDHIQPLEQNPGLSLVKSGTLSTGSNGVLNAGDQIDYIFVVSNTGNVTLTNVVLSDTNATLLSGTLSSLEPGASGTFSGYHVLTQEQINSGTFTNIATVSGYDPNNANVSDTDDHVQPLIQFSGLSLVKSGTLSTGSNGLVNAGGQIEYTFVVSNTGNVTLTDVVLTDTNAFLTSGSSIASLAPGESGTFTGYHALTQAQVNSGSFKNIATVAGFDPKGNNRSASDDHTENFLRIPGLVLLKSGTLSTGSNGVLDRNDRIEYTFVVSNTGNVTLSNIVLTDTNATLVSGTLASLLPGASGTFTGYHVLTQAQINSGTFTNIATVRGTDPGSTTVSGTDDHIQPLTQNPQIELIKSGTLATGSNGKLDAGDRINYTFEVTNTGNVTLTDIVLSDTNATSISGTLATLAPGDTNTNAFTGYHVLTQAEIDSGTFTNIATVSGKDPNGSDVQDTDDHIQPLTRISGLSLIKSGTLVSGSNNRINDGDRIEYRFVVSNTGNVTLTDVVLSDTNATLVSGSSLASLAPGASGTFTGYHVLTQTEIDSGTFTNIAGAKAQDPLEREVSDEDSDTKTFLFNISGRVFHTNSNRPTSGVTVRLLDSGSNQIASATTDSLGRYSFGNLPNGTYYVREVNPTGVIGGFDVDDWGGADEIKVELDGASVLNRDFTDYYVDPIETYTYCRNILIINVFSGLPPGTWSLLSVGSIGSGSLRNLGDGRVQFTPRINYYGNVSDSFVVKIKDADGKEYDRVIRIKSIESIGGSFQALLQPESGYDVSADPGVLPKDVTGLVRVTLDRDAIATAQVNYRNETLTFRGQLAGRFSLIQTVNNAARQPRKLELSFDVSADTWTAKLSGTRAVSSVGFPTRILTSTPALSGSYTVVFSEESFEDNYMGCATGSVTSSGAMNLSTLMTRGTNAFNISGQLLKNGLTCFYTEPVVASPNGYSLAVLLDWSGAGPVFKGSAEWRFQTLVSGSAVWQTRRLNAQFARYNPVSNSAAVLGQTQALKFNYNTDGTGQSFLTLTSTSAYANSVQARTSGTNGFILTLSRPTGLWSGTMTSGTVRTLLRGVTLQPNGEAVGFGISTREPQPVWLLKP